MNIISIEEKIIEEIKLIRGISEINLDDRIFHDLWLYGDDAYEVNDTISLKYDITESEFDSTEYWPDEEPYIFLAKWFYPKYLNKWKPMTVRELAQHIYSAIEKKNCL